MDFTRALQHTIAVIDRWLSYVAYADPRVPGLSAAIVYKDQIIFHKGYGYADIAQKTPVTDLTCYRIASISKIFTTIAILQLVEEGKVALDARVRDYLPWFTSSHDQNLHFITLRQLLTHTSGLERDGDTPHWADFHFPTFSSIRQHIEAGATVFPPLEQWKYSNYGFTLLGEVIKQVSRMSYEAYVTRNIVERLNLSHTAPVLTDTITSQLATGYGRSLPHREKEPFPTIETNVMASATGFSSNVLDLCQFMQAQFDGNTLLLRDETKRDMRRLQWLREDTASSWSLGLETWRVNGRRLYGHGGSFPGYKSRFAFDPECSIGIVVLTNAIDALASDILNSIWECLHYFIKHDDIFAAASADENLPACVGTFRSIWNDVELVAIADYLLYYTLETGSPAKSIRPLRYEQNGQYRIISDDGFGHLGETLHFECESDRVNTIYIGSNPFQRLNYADEK